MTSDNIVPFAGTPPNRNPPANDAAIWPIVEDFASHMCAAQDGKVRAYALAYILPNGHVSINVNAGDAKAAMLVGAVNVLNHRLCSVWDSDIGEIDTPDGAA